MLIGSRSRLDSIDRRVCSWKGTYSTLRSITGRSNGTILDFPFYRVSQNFPNLIFVFRGMGEVRACSYSPVFSRWSEADRKPIGFSKVGESKNGCRFVTANLDREFGLAVGFRHRSS